jgi:glycosyltransferase involved in cell wall biosynthesis
MNVLYLTMNPNRASTTVPTEGWLRTLRDRGLRPVIASNQIGAFHAWALDQKIPSYHVPLPFPSKLTPVSFLKSLWKLRRIVKRHDVQLIHCNEQDIYPIGQYVARWCRLPVVVSIHCKVEAPYFQWAFRGRRTPDRLIFISRGNQEACRPGVQGVVPEDRWRLFPNALDLERFRPDAALGNGFRNEHRLGAGTLIGVACALRPGKQIEHLFNVAAALPKGDFRVVVAGGPVPGTEAYASELLARGRAQLGERFVALGHLSELRGFYNSLDLFVNTSEEEAGSISILESLACGCPVVGYPSISVAEQVLPGGGEIVEQNNIGQLASAVANWLGAPDRLRTGRFSARKRAEGAHDIRRISESLWSEYQSLVANGRLAAR